METQEAGMDPRQGGAAGQPEAITIPPEALREIARLYDQSRYVEAFAIARRHGPLTAWGGPEAGAWAGRLAANLGGGRLSHIIHRRNHRRHPDNLSAGCYYAHGLLDRRGPLATRDFLRKLRPSGTGDDPDARIHLLTLNCFVAEAFRDFTTATEWLRQADAVDANHPWLIYAWSSLLERQDRYEEALERGRQAMAQRTVFRPGVQQVAHLLQVLDRDEEALELLRTASARSECAAISLQLANLLLDLESHEEALREFDRALELSPLADRRYLAWINRQRLAAACRQGDLGRARELALALKDPSAKELIGRLDRGDTSRRRVILPVPFVRQHHMTCSPATLSALSRFWNRPADHLEVAERICYDGTPAHSERHWAESQGWLAREFTVTWETAVALIDRGIPFTLTTSETRSAHLQAVIGYDQLRRSLYLRDPFVYYKSEAFCPQFLELYAATGPRGMLLLPPEEAGRLADLELPDAELYDRLHQVNRALFDHRRADAAAVLADLVASHPDHRLTLTARRSMAGYDTNTPAMLAAVEELLARFPRDGNLRMARLSCLESLARREARLEQLETWCAEPGADPLLWAQLAGELRLDGRLLPQASRCIRRALRYRPLDPECLRRHADILWDLRELEEATEMYRLALCLDDKQEGYARGYFLAARHLRQTGPALETLRQRFETLGRRSPWPALTLASSLTLLNRVPEAFDVLSRARGWRPDDTTLLLEAADLHARHGQFEEAAALLNRAESGGSRSTWLRTAATLAAYRSDRRRALELWREVLSTEPLALDAIRATAFLTAETEGFSAADQFLDQACARFPAHCGLHALRVEVLREHGGAADVEPALRRLIEINPVDAWAHRELALALKHLNRTEEAFAAANRALELDPRNPFGYATRGDLEEHNGRLREAREDFRQALRLSIDTGFAMEHLVACCSSPAERLEAIDFIQGELVRQVVFGDALGAFRAIARGILEPEPLLDRLREALAARPDLWQAWSEVAVQLRDLNRLDEALDLISQATDRFPLHPRLWMERAGIHRARLETDGMTLALEKAWNLQPGFAEAARELAEAALRAGDKQRALEVLEQACAQSPLDAINRGCLADVLWRLDRRTEALDQLRQAIRLLPGYTWAWRQLHDWSVRLEQPDLAIEMSRDLVDRRPGEARSWMLLAEAQAERRDPAAIATADRAIGLAPLVPDTHDLKAVLLTRFDRFEEALACCQPAGFAEPPALLRKRAAWIEAQRGNLEHAIRLLRAVLDAQPADAHGWQLLSDWCAQTGDLDLAVDAADKLVRLAPHDPIPLAHSGDLHLRKDDRPGAIARFRRAFRLDPEYAYAGFSLFDLLLEDQDLAGAGEILDELRRHVPGELVEARTVQLRARQSRPVEALEVFTRLCRTTTDAGWCLFASATALVGAGQTRKLRRIIRRTLRESDANPWLGALQVQQRFAGKTFNPGRWLHRLVERGPLGRNALGHYLDQAAETWSHYTGRGDSLVPRQIRFHVGRLIRRHVTTLKSDDLLWGKTGYVLATMHRYRELAAWLQDWRHRPKLESWMIYNLVLGLQLTGRHPEALEVIRHGLQMHNSRELFQAFAVWAAFESALAGDAADAERWTSSVDPDRLGPIDRALHFLAQALLEARSPKGQSIPHGHLLRIKEFIRLATSRRAPWRTHRIVRQSYRRAVRKIAADSGSRSFRVWSFLHHIGLR